MTVADHSWHPLFSHDCASLTDGELLEHFVGRGDQTAFAALLHRHGPMVLGVCRRMLNNEADAEDAFQATFLVLVRKAASIRPGGMVGNWLYGVAHSTALKARAMSKKRIGKEHEAAMRAKPPSAAPTWHDLLPILDQELKALPNKYRAAVVLCDIEGKSHKEVARQLGCPLGTIGTRVARGRLMLARRLTRHGVAPSAATLAMLLTHNAATAAVPASLTNTTARAASQALSGSAATETSATVAALTAAVLKSMLATKLKLAAAGLLAFTLFASVAATVAYSPLFANPSRIARNHRSDKHRLQNTWVVTSVINGGQELPAEALSSYGELTLDCERFTARLSGQGSGTFKIDATRDPDEIDINLHGAALPAHCPPLSGLGIYKLEGRTLTICLARSTRPQEFTATNGEQGTSLFVLQRKPADKNKRGP